ncbi:MAG: PrsW family glutamic-type intramembrane protease [Candidatus Liptonbacteria bacterium]
MAFLAALSALIPGFAWLYFYLKEDSHPEPKLLIAKTFIAGGACAFIALAAQLALQKVGFSFDVVQGAYGATLRLVITIFIFSLIEELVKFGAAYVSVHNDPAFQEPIDAMIYTIVAALGFATVENIGAVQQNIGGATQAQFLGLVFQTLTLRFVGATLLHSLSSGLIGYYWALSVRSFRSNYILVWGILLGSGLHAVFNYLILSYGNLMYAVGFVVVMGISVLGDFEKLKLKPI